MKIHCRYDAMVPLAELIENPKNPNVHDLSQIKRLAELFSFHGIRHPIIVSSRSGFIVAGHGRKQAAITAGMEFFPVVFQDFKDEAAEYAFVVADNAIADWATLDKAMINAEIEILGPEIPIEMLGMRDFAIEPMDKFVPDDAKNQGDLDGAKFALEVLLPNEQEMSELHEELVGRGFIVRPKR